VTLFNCYSRHERTLPDVDMVVIVTPSAPNDELFAQLRQGAVEVHAVGDRVAPGDIETATFEGHRIARQI